jgi:hypothetical protein
MYNDIPQEQQQYRNAPWEQQQPEQPAEAPTMRGVLDSGVGMLAG